MVTASAPSAPVSSTQSVSPSVAPTVDPKVATNIVAQALRSSADIAVNSASLARARALSPTSADKTEFYLAFAQLFDGFNTLNNGLIQATRGGEMLEAGSTLRENVRAITKPLYDYNRSLLSWLTKTNDGVNHNLDAGYYDAVIAARDVQAAEIGEFAIYMRSAADSIDKLS